MLSAKTDVFLGQFGDESPWIINNVLLYTFSLSSKVSLLFFLMKKAWKSKWQLRKCSFWDGKVSFSYGVGGLVESIYTIYRGEEKQCKLYMEKVKIIIPSFELYWNKADTFESEEVQTSIIRQSKWWGCHQMILSLQ